MTNIIDKQLNRMLSLMGPRTINEAQKKAQDPVEYSTKGPDGNYYGIVREGAKYYIKQAKPNEKGLLVKESFEYIGGFMRRKANEYPSFASAMRNLEGKLGSLNEAIKRNATLVECSTDKSKSKRVIIEAKGQMRADIKRQLEIMNNAQILDEQRSSYKSMNTLTECDNREVGATPFTVGDECGDNFDQKGLPKGKKTGEYKEKVVKGGKAIIGKFNGNIQAEGRKGRNIFEAEDEEEPIDDAAEMPEEMPEDFAEGEPTEDAAEMPLGDGFDEDGFAEEGEDFGGEFEDEFGGEGDDLETEEFEDNVYEIYADGDDDITIKIKKGSPEETGEFEDDNLYDEGEEGEEGEDDEEESPIKAEGVRRRNGRMINEENYFGKHPRYLAEPFTLPKAHAQYDNTYDMNDESVDNEERPFQNKQRYRYYSERPKSIPNSLGIAEGFLRKKKVR